MGRTNKFVNIYKLCNSGTNEEKYELIKKGKLIVPRYIDVELTNLCNFSCRFCPTGTKSIRRIKGFMPDIVVDALVDNINKYYISGVRFIRWGEPTMHPKHVEIMQRLKNAGDGCLIHINTNGSLLDEKLMHDYIDIGLDSIKFSFQGADEESYNEMRKGGDFQKLIDIIKKFHKLRGNKEKPYIQFSTTLTTESTKCIETFKRLIEPYCDYYNIGFTKLNHLNITDMDISDNEKSEIFKLKKNEKLNHIFNDVCNEAFDKLSINQNGDVTLCCSDYDNFIIIGNILDSDLKQLFTSAAANQYRDVIIAKQYSKIKCCSTCYNVIPLQK